MNNQWRPIVDDQIPEEAIADWVLVAVKAVPENHYVVPEVARFSRGAWYAKGDDHRLEDWYSVKVTHWMPLPEPPEEVNSND